MDSLAEEIILLNDRTLEYEEAEVNLNMSAEKQRIKQRMAEYCIAMCSICNEKIDDGLLDLEVTSNFIEVDEGIFSDRSMVFCKKAFDLRFGNTFCNQI